MGTGTALLSGKTPIEMMVGSTSLTTNDSWTGYGGVGDYATSNGNTRPVMVASHLIRDGKKADIMSSAKSTGEIFDLVVVGGGFSGLGAAFQFQAKTESKSCLILDNHPVFGGEAKENEFSVDGYRLFGPQGSNGFLPPKGRTTLSDDVWRTVGMPMEYEFADTFSDLRLKTPYDSYDSMYWGEKNFDIGHFFQGKSGSRWERNIWNDDLVRTPWSDELKRDMLRAFHGKETAHGMKGLGPWLDSMTYQYYLEEKLSLHPGVTDYIDPILAISNYGFGCDVISAYGAYLLQLPGMKGYFQADTFDFETAKIMSFPGGNTTYARHIVKHLIPNAISGKEFEEITLGKINFNALDEPNSSTRIRLNSTVIDIRHAGEKVQVTYSKNGEPEQILARSVVVSSAGFMARSIVSDMPRKITESYNQFHHGPALVVNVALNNWRFLEKLGVSAARWYDGFGYFASIRAPMHIGKKTSPYHPDKPMVMTFYVPLHTKGLSIRDQEIIGRGKLLSKVYVDYEREIRTHMNDLFYQAGFDAKNDIAGIILNRWGHAYVAPQPGFYFGGSEGNGLAAPIKKGHGRIFYGHSELGSRMNYRNAIAEGGRAGEQAAGI